MINTVKNLLNHVKQSATDPFKTASKRAIQQTAEASSNLIGNKIANVVTKSYNSQITGVSKHLQQNNLEKAKMSMIKKYLKKDTYLHKKDKKLLIN